MFDYKLPLSLQKLWSNSNNLLAMQPVITSLYDILTKTLKENNVNSINALITKDSTALDRLQIAISKNSVSKLFSNLREVLKLNLSNVLKAPEGINFIKKYEDPVFLTQAQDSLKHLLDDLTPIYSFDLVDLYNQAGISGFLVGIIYFNNTITSLTEFSNLIFKDLYSWFKEYYKLVLNNYFDVLLNPNFLKRWKTSTLNLINQNPTDHVMRKLVSIPDTYDTRFFYDDLFVLINTQVDFILQQFFSTNEVKVYNKEEDTSYGSTNN